MKYFQLEYFPIYSSIASAEYRCCQYIDLLHRAGKWGSFKHIQHVCHNQNGLAHVRSSVMSPVLSIKGLSSLTIQQEVVQVEMLLYKTGTSAICIKG